MGNLYDDGMGRCIVPNYTPNSDLLLTNSQALYVVYHVLMNQFNPPKFRNSAFRNPIDQETPGFRNPSCFFAFYAIPKFPLFL